MSDIILRIFLIVIAALFAYIVIRNTIKKKIIEKESMIWVLITILIILLSAVPNIIIWFAHYLGVEYAPTLLFVVTSLILLLMVFRHSQKISELEHKTKDLAQRIALLEMEDR